MFFFHKEAFISLGHLLRNLKGIQNYSYTEGFEAQNRIDKLRDLAENSHRYNSWFTPENIFFALEQWGGVLQKKEIEEWLSHYNLPVKSPKTIGLVTAGNLPLVGFHDFMCVLLSGHYLLIKNSSQDTGLMNLVSEVLFTLEPDLKKRVRFTKQLEKFDALIVTGSDHTANYFNYHFKDKPTLIRKNRTSVALLQGDESQEELYGLGNDILRYFGRGCRSVSKLFLPKNYPLETLFSGLRTHKSVIENPKYASNYRYYKSIYHLKKIHYKENGFVLFKEDKALFSPLSVVFYEYYDHLEEIKKYLKNQKDNLQCIVGRKICSKTIPFGKTQLPKLTDYADGVDTLNFLEGL